MLEPDQAMSCTCLAALLLYGATEQIPRCCMTSVMVVRPQKTKGTCSFKACKTESRTLGNDVRSVSNTLLAQRADTAFTGHILMCNRRLSASHGKLTKCRFWSKTRQDKRQDKNYKLGKVEAQNPRKLRPCCAHARHHRPDFQPGQQAITAPHRPAITMQQPGAVRLGPPPREDSGSSSRLGSYLEGDEPTFDSARGSSSSGASELQDLPPPPLMVTLVWKKLSVVRHPPGSCILGPRGARSSAISPASSNNHGGAVRMATNCSAAPDHVWSSARTLQNPGPRSPCECCTRLSDGQSRDGLVPTLSGVSVQSTC